MKFYCRLDHPKSYDNIELNEIVRSLKANGCWPPYTSDPHPHQPMMNNDNVENGNSEERGDIYVPKAETSGAVTEQPQSSPSSSGSMASSSTKAKNKGKGKQRQRKFRPADVRTNCEDDPYDPLKIPVADNSQFSNDSQTKEEIDLKDTDEGKVSKGYYFDDPAVPQIETSYSDYDITHCAEGIVNKIAKPLSENFTGLMCMLHGFRICFI